jgi:hypothetical protein
MEASMTSRERVLCALQREVPDRIPWVEGIVSDDLATRLCGETIRVHWDIAPDGTFVSSGAELASIHPIQPDVMDIVAVKARYGDRRCLVGNIIMDDLVHKRPEDIRAQVRDRIERIGAGGGYIISSSNSLTADMKDENVRAMAEAIRDFGVYG